jgi:hypothetical protein
MHECVLHIELMNMPGGRGDQGEDCANIGWLDHRAEGLIVVDAG